jgi:hypothetical protein
VEALPLLSEGDNTAYSVSDSWNRIRPTVSVRAFRAHTPPLSPGFVQESISLCSLGRPFQQVSIAVVGRGGLFESFSVPPENDVAMILLVDHHITVIAELLAFRGWLLHDCCRKGCCVA